MENRLSVHVLSFFLLMGLSCGKENFGGRSTGPQPEFRHFYGIAWNGKPGENLAYARQMGDHYVFYQRGMEKDTLSNGLYFYLETPEYSIYPRRIETQKTYSTAEIHFFETHCALMNLDKPFPNNIARGWFIGPYVFTPQLDYQQQKVIDWAIDSTLAYVQSIEAANPRFRFGGFAWDVPQPAGDFWDTVQHPGRQITLQHWTGGDHGMKHPEVTHDFSTFSDGRIAYYKQLFGETKKRYPNAKFIMEPYKIYEDWIRWIKDRPDAVSAMPDILAQEKDGVEFVEDNRIFESTLIKKEFVCSTTPNIFGEVENRTTAAKAALHGAWFSWYGRFGGTGHMPGYKSITEVPPRIKLIRMLANWENLNGTPIPYRSWDGTTYESQNAFASSDVISLKQPRSNKLFVVFLTENGEVILPESIKSVKIFRTSDLFIESTNGESDFILNNNRLRIKDSVNLGKGYILHLS